MDCGLNHGLDYRLYHEMDRCLDCGLDSVVLRHLKTINAGLPNEERTCVQLSARLVGLGHHSVLHVQPASPAAWQGFIGVAF